MFHYFLIINLNNINNVYLRSKERKKNKKILNSYNYIMGTYILLFIFY